MLWSEGLSAALLGGLVLCGLGSGSALAQDYTTGGVNGRVLDEQGVPISGAHLTLQSKGTGLSRKATTNDRGEYRFPRLPVGAYTLSAEAQDHNNWTDENVAVSVGSSKSLNIVLSGGEMTDRIVVTGSRRPAIDFDSSTTGIVLDVDSISQEIPVPRNLTSLALLAPGTVSGDSSFGGASIGGSSVAENAYYVDGMNVTDFRNFLGSANPPYEFYKQVEVKTGGYPAEFGRSTGGVVNAVTKSGSNDIHYGFNAFWAPAQLRDTSPDTKFRYNRRYKNNDRSFNFYASGPLIKDKVFFYALYAPQKITTESYTVSGRKYVREYDRPFWGGKIDVNLTDNHLFSFTAYSNKRTARRDVYNTNKNGEFIGFTDYENGGEVYIAKYTGVLRDWLTVSALYGHQTSDDLGKPSTIQNNYIYDSRGTSGIQLGNVSSSTIATDKDTRKLFRADVDVFVNFFGEHSIRLGMDTEDLQAETLTRYTGSGTAYNYYKTGARSSFGVPVGTEIARLSRYTNGGSLKTKQTAFYIQDSWTIKDRLTLNFGVRNETFDNKNAKGESFVKADNQIAPRFGFVYDVSGDGQSKFFGSWGRYYLPIATNTNIRMASRENFVRTYHVLNGLNPDNTPQLGRLLRTTVLQDGSIADARTLRSENLDPMYSDELILGYEKNFDQGFFSNWTFGINYTRRELQSLIEDAAVDAAVIKWAGENGYDVDAVKKIWAGFHQYALINPGKDAVIYTKELPGKEGQYVRMDLSAADLGYPKGKRVYDAVELTFKRKETNWGLGGSYTWSRLKGNYEGSVKSDNGQDDAGITQDFDQPGLTDGSYGFLPNHREHKFKVWGNYDFDNGVRVKFNYSLKSPRKFGCIGVHPTDEFAQGYDAASWYCGGKLTPRGSQLESDWIHRLDLGVAYVKPLNGGTVTFSLDIFNVLGLDGVNDLYEEGEKDSGAVDTRYGAPTGYQTPRYFRLGLSFKY